MATKVSPLFPILFFVLLASVENVVRADTCSEGLGTCGLQNCDPKCKARHGPAAQGSCDRTSGPGLCTCYFPCGPTPLPPTPPRGKMCNAGLGTCSFRCDASCCNQKCASKYLGGNGLCNNIGASNLCQCQYPC